MSSGDGRHALNHLLDPLRELSVELDLAGELEEYLQVINVDESVLVNFAQAALLVQQSSALYSKKVEHLYTLVLDTLAHLQSTDVREQQAPLTGGKPTATKRQKTNQGRAAASAHGTTDGSSTVLTMADMTAEANQINWTVRTHVEESKKVDMPPPNPALQKRRDLDKSTNTKTFQASMVMMGSFVSMENDSGESLKLKSCRVDPQTGALYLDESSKDLLAFSRPHVASSATLSNSAPPPLQRAAVPLLTPVREEDDAGAANSRLSREIMQDAADDNNEPDFGWNVDELSHADEGPVATSTATDDQDGAWRHQRHEAFGPSTSPALLGMATESRHLYGDSHIHDEDDPWRLLDAYEAKDCVVKPFRKGPTSRTRLPNVAKLAQAAMKVEPVYTPLQRRQQQRLGRLRDHLLSKPFKLFTDTSRVGASLSATAPLRAEYAKCFAKLQPPSSNPWSFGAKQRPNKSGYDEKKSGGSLPEAQDELVENDYDDDGVDFDDGYGPGYDNGDDNDDDNDEDVEDVPTVKKAPRQAADGDAALKDEDDGVSRHLEWATTTDADDDAMKSEPPTSYEALCKLHIEQFMQGTERYMKETSTSKKVAEWQRKLAPVLDDQDRRPPFDIKACGDTIVHKLEETRDDAAAVGFDHVVHDMSSYEICRIFSAVLHLANQGAVELSHDDADAGMDSLRLTMVRPDDANDGSASGQSRRQRKRR